MRILHIPRGMWMYRIPIYKDLEWENKSPEEPLDLEYEDVFLFSSDPEVPPRGYSKKLDILIVADS